MNHRYNYTLAMAVLLACAITSCSPESSDAKLGPAPTAAFTATPMSGKPNKIIVSNATPGGFMWQWEDGNGGKSKKEVDTFSYFRKGEYTIQMTVFTNGGYAATAQKVTIAGDAPTQDILKGGTMEAGSEQNWTILNTGGTQTTIKIENGVMNFSNTGNSNGAVYQAINVTAGKSYVFSGNVKGNGATNSWFEVYFGATAPKQGSDYSGTKFVSLNTWTGCGKIPFDGNLNEIGCDGAGTGQSGIMKFNTTGTIYMVIKAGSAGGTLGAGGISLDNVKFLEEI
ncbi:hypothetical protein [Chitinophaga tropicalis]|uniref:PKD domain-containing protein n=1 Tax=Chitinophaga tropicalis TaxID=2683588 RepID=A0A7K1UCP2_9BACT|nr:hypothetical protein [Chitinophaga tropicalis]MVT12040.1 hypothetical protein [Chitinophaga tropicalis]